MPTPTLAKASCQKLAAKPQVEQLDAMLSVNLRSVFLTAREGARRMIANEATRDRRRIVLMASILGLKAQAGSAVYGATKAGVIMLAKNLALEWARHGINVNALCPGYMPTDIVEGWFETDPGRAMMARWPRRELMPLDALDEPLLLLLSSGTTALTGVHLPVDDGQCLG